MAEVGRQRLIAESQIGVWRAEDHLYAVFVGHAFDNSLG